MSIKHLFKLLVTGLISISASGLLHAEYDAGELQKLFTDKRQRLQIDAARSGNYSEPNVQDTSKVTINGYVTRSGGNSVVWVNNKNSIENGKVAGVKVRQSNIGKNKKVTLNVQGKTIRLKAGESWSEASDLYDGK